MELPIKRKAFAVITRGDGDGREVLLLFHPDHPEAGIQLPAGTMRDGEEPLAAVLREATEETGLTHLSVVGTLVTDNLTDALGVPLEISTAVFAVALTATFAVWYRVEGTLSIHSIVSVRREAFYWLAVLLTFALGTAVGDLVDERFGVGYWPTALVVALLIAAVAAGHMVFGANAVLTFWIAYVLTRPLGASLGDGLSQPRTDGGLGLGTTWTSVLFLVAILAVVVHLSVTGHDQDRVPADEVAQRGW